MAGGGVGAAAFGLSQNAATLANVGYEALIATHFSRTDEAEDVAFARVGHARPFCSARAEREIGLFSRCAGDRRSKNDHLLRVTPFKGNWKMNEYIAD